jgi:transposase
LSAVAQAHPDAEVQLWCQDEARVGQKGRGTRVWYERGSRPSGVVDHRYASAWLHAAIRPGTDEAFALITTEVGTATTQAFLDAFGASLPKGVHAALLLDGAGWHTARDIVVPDNVSLVFLPPYSPELNPVERVWLYLRERYLSLRLFADLDAVIEGCRDAWNKLLNEPGRVASLTDYPYLRKVGIS